MNSIGHSQFIMTPISTIIKETNVACRSLGSGIEIHPMGSYIMQTTFLRMTGASEQKLKCICWEIASFDYEFRYEMLRDQIGECSSYTDKKKIFKSICESLKRYGESPKFSDTDKDSIIRKSYSGLSSILGTSPQALIFEKEFMAFKDYSESIKLSDERKTFCNVDKKDNIQFLEEKLKVYYTDYVYRQRNRYAHNLTSYQINVPTLTQLRNNNSKENNHFRMFSLLIMMDEIFMKLFEKFEAMKSKHSYC